MKLSLFLGDYAYSSWSLRGWLLLSAFGIEFQERLAHMRTADFESMKVDMAPARTVPALRITHADHKDVIVWDSLAIAETVHEMFPKAGLWPTDPGARATARALAAEMHAGFSALRGACPMNMRRAYAGFAVSKAVQADLARLSELWAHARALYDGPYLCGAFSAADVFFAPVASRIATYDLPLPEADRTYVHALLAHPSVQAWYARAQADGHVQAHYELDLAARPNPHDLAQA